MNRDSIRFSELSGMGNPSDATAGILPPLSYETAREMQAFLVRPLVETGLLASAILFVLLVLY